MFAIPLLVRMLIFITIEQCEQIFHCKTLQVGGGGGEGKRAVIHYYLQNSHMLKR